MRFALMLVILATLSSPAGRAVPQADIAAIESFVAEQFRASRAPGMAVAVVQRDAVVFTQNLGVADSFGRPVTSATPFGIGSITKSFTALGVVQLAETGRIALDAPVQRYLPEFRLADPCAAAITVRQLLNQTSGLPTTAGFWDAGAIPAADQVLARVRALADQRLVHAPGAAHTYSNANYDLAGLLIERVSGQSYEQYIHEQVFTPLQMTASSVVTAPGQRSGVAQGFQSWYGLALPSTQTMRNRGVAPGGGIFSSAADMARYLSAHLDAGRGRSAIVGSRTAFATLRSSAASRCGPRYASIQTSPCC